MRAADEPYEEAVCSCVTLVKYNNGVTRFSFRGYAKHILLIHRIASISLVCVRVCMYMCMCIWLRMYMCMWSMFAYVCVCKLMYVYAYVYVCMYMYMNVCWCVYGRVHVY